MSEFKTYIIEGMTCASCVIHVEKALDSIPGIDSAVVNLVNKSATIRVLETVDDADVISAVKAAGYQARPLVEIVDPQQAARDWKVIRVLQIKSIVNLCVGLVLMGVTLFGLVPDNPNFVWGVLSLVIVLVLSTGAGLLSQGINAFGRGQPDMNSLVSLGIMGSLLFSVVQKTVFLAPFHELAVEAGPMILGFVLLGRSLEERAMRRGAMALESLSSLVPTTAHVLLAGIEIEHPADQLREGDRILVKPEEVYPCDGLVESGEGEADESLLTGEFVSLFKAKGSRVYKGTVNLDGTLEISVSAAAGSSVLDSMMSRLSRAQASKPGMVKIGDRIAAVFVPVVMIFAGLMFLGHGMLGLGWQAGITASLNVLLIACPCALGLAAPMAASLALGSASRLGILFKDSEALERAASVSGLVFDKTGTLTRGKPVLKKVLLPDDNHDEVLAKEMLMLAAGLEGGSNHPLAVAVLEAIENIEKVPPVAEFKNHPGSGISGVVHGRHLRLGRATFCLQGGEGEKLRARVKNLGERFGYTGFYLAEDQRLIAAFLFEDQLRPETVQILQDLNRIHMKLYLASGDGMGAVAAAVEGLPFEEYRSSQKPAEKAEWLAELENRGERAAMVGDGINDAEALAASYLGIAMGEGAEAARRSGEVVLLRSDIGLLGPLFHLARKSVAIIKQNFAWALIYNVVMVPAAAGLVPGITFKPIWAAGAMALSSLAVVANSLRLSNERVRG